MAGKASPAFSPVPNSQKKDKSAAPEFPGVGINEIAAYKITQICTTEIHSQILQAGSQLKPKNLKIKYAIEHCASCSQKPINTLTISTNGFLAIAFKHLELCTTVLIVL